MHLINNQELYKLHVGSLTALPGDNVPFLWGSYDDLSLVDLLPRQMRVAGKLSHSDAVGFEPSLKVAYNFWD